MKNNRAMENRSRERERMVIPMIYTCIQTRRWGGQVASIRVVRRTVEKKEIQGLDLKETEKQGFRGNESRGGIKGGGEAM